MIFCLVEVSASQSNRKCSMSSVILALHISQFVYPSVCPLSMLIFKVPVLPLNKVIVAAELLYKPCFNVFLNILYKLVITIIVSNRHVN